MTPAWQRRRSEFNHNWLKNQFISALAGFLNLLDDEVENIDLERSFVSVVLPEWEAHREEGFDLARDFEQEMSPGRLFDRLPLSRCDEHTKQWLESLVHVLWLSRYPVRRWTASVVACIEEVDAAYSQLQEALQNCVDVRSAPALLPFREQFVVLRKRCQRLGEAISEFPGKVYVT